MCAVCGQDALGDRFVNNAVTAVVDSLLGTVYSNPNVGMFDFGKVVVRRDYADDDIVKVVSGGSSGHEPAHAGFVGKGMLTAAVQGDVFSAPTTTEVLKTIKELSYKQLAGVLIIVQNHTSDCLNFGVAAERASKEGIEVKMLVVSDDCCVRNRNEGRGLGGIVLLNKIAGAMSESKRSLEQIFQFCQKALQNMSSILLLLKSCIAPNAATCICTKHLGCNEMEVGSGLHGEPGFRRMRRSTVESACAMLIEEISRNFLLDSSMPVVVLVNNLGSSLQVEELIFVKEFVKCLQGLNIVVNRVYHGQFLTALDMKGFSVTILKVYDEEVLKYLDYPCQATAWGGQVKKVMLSNSKEPLPSRVKHQKPPKLKGPRLSERQANIMGMVVQFVCDALSSCEKHINIMDSENGSGNVGSKIKRGAEVVTLEMRKKMLDCFHPKLFFIRLSSIAETSVCGALGSLYSVLFEAASNSFRGLSEKRHVDIELWFKCLTDATRALKSYGGTNYGCGTMYDPLYACAATMKDALRTDASDMEVFGLGVVAAENAAECTKQRLNRYPDPGARAVAIWMRALYEGIQLML